MKLDWADYAAVQASYGNLSGNEVTRNSSGNARSQSSQLAEPLWSDLGLNSGISGHKLISTLNNNNKKKRRQGMNERTFSPNPRTREKKKKKKATAIVKVECCWRLGVFVRYHWFASL